ncbi:MAG TPA: glutathione S-transferase family protein [Burkholderiales bacterium]|nr:glutathione S-transferase family protein [Burkholderiales bacterium]
MTMKVYGWPNTRSLRAVWALEEAGVTYDYVPINLMRGEGRHPAYLGMNPGGKVPTLVDGDLVITESAAICNYIGDKYPASGLTPRCGIGERAIYDKWCFFVLTELEQPLWTIGKHRFAIPEKYRIPAMVDTAIWEFSVAAKALDAQFGSGPFALGERFSAVDILLGHTLAWAEIWSIPLDHERLRDYARRLRARPALSRARRREEQAVAGIVSNA